MEQSKTITNTDFYKPGNNKGNYDQSFIKGK
jgi:hypothetical protein